VHLVGFTIEIPVYWDARSYKGQIVYHVSCHVRPIFPLKNAPKKSPRILTTDEALLLIQTIKYFANYRVRRITCSALGLYSTELYLNSWR
jgi:hypothetical protein